MRAAVIQGDAVANVILLADDADPVVFRAVHCPNEVQIGWGYADGRFVAPPAPEPEPAPAPNEISDRQFAQVLALDGVITEDEALAWAARGDLPARLTEALTQIPEAGGQRFGAKMLLSAATTYERDNPLVPMLGGLLGMDGAALDSIWTRGAALR